MKTEIKLIRKGWVNITRGDVSVWVRGQAHLGDVYYDTKSLVELFVGKSYTVASLDEVVSRLNGCWALVVRNDEWVYIAVDHSRSYQVLYSCESYHVLVSDDIRTFDNGLSSNVLEDAIHEYLSSCVVWRNRTVFSNILSIQAGERVLIQDHGISSMFLLPIRPTLKSPIPTEELFQRVDRAFVHSMQRLTESVGTRRIVVPLSGGYDSRLIVSYLDRISFRNVICYSYGKQGNEEARISRSVAEALGYEWYFAETSLYDVRWDKTMLDYCSFAGNGCGTPFTQEYDAIRKLKLDGVLHPTDVITPGHCLDVYAGSDIKSYMPDWGVVSAIFGAFCRYVPQGDYKRCCKDLSSYVEETCSGRSVKEAFDIFSFSENLAKGIFNSLRNYEWFGYEWRMPLTDKELFDLWLSMGRQLRLARGYFKMIANRLYQPQIRDIPFVGAESGGNPIKKWIKNQVWWRIPYRLQRLSRLGRVVTSAEHAMWDDEIVQSHLELFFRRIKMRGVESRIKDNMKKKCMGLRPLLVLMSVIQILENKDRILTECPND